jgi:uncharacterized protein (TIGR00251 family)
MPFFHVDGDKVLLAIKAVPGASRTEIAGVEGDRLRVRVAAAPEDGKANAALRAFLAKTLSCPKKDVALISGEKSRFKTITLPAAVQDAVSALG